ncbi:Cell death protease [Coemansia javaensis]|uniref:Pheromone-processing carboxypeptidase KEX1 n=1 Tax=Coemansia javaensis TaxID=2761396 RepID=A0A9W8HHQ0_9FUNG|nr:Cell death protease [Coemansia javaensis]
MGLLRDTAQDGAARLALHTEEGSPSTKLALHTGDSATGDSSAGGNSTAEAPLPDRSEFVVRSIPFQDDKAFDSLRQYAGQMPMGGAEDVMFFWLVANATNSRNQDKLLIWLNGGPGCTSLDGVFMENGPYKFHGPNRLRFRDYSLSQQFDVLYIDQPFGTGFSMAPASDYATSFKNATKTLHDFVARFYRVFPEYRQRELYIAGESEAGVYIPYLADSMLQAPQAERFRLRGIMIGNGWVDPYPMYMSYLELLRVRGMLTPDVHKKMLAAMDKCTHEFNRAPQPVHTSACEDIPIVFLDDGGPQPGMCYNQYDLRLTDTQPDCGMNWPPEVGIFTDYLNRKDVQQAINVRSAPKTWTECNNRVNHALRTDTSPPSVSLLPHILDSIPVLFFVGKEDYLCNYIGTEWTIGNLTWAGSRGMGAAAAPAPWTIDGDEVGRVVSARGLTYALVSNASHMVGVDKPREMLDLFTAFTNGSSSNLPFRSSLRGGNADSPSPPPPPPAASPLPAGSGAGSAGKWAGLGAALLLTVLFLTCFLRRKQLLAWWAARSHSGYGPALSADGPFAADASSRDLDDAFMMHDLAKHRSHDSLDVAGLLLDDDPASSPDDEQQPRRQ